MELIHFQYKQISHQGQHGDYILKRNPSFRIVFTKKGVLWGFGGIALTRSETEELKYIIESEIENVDEE